jgi:hypothetical protein
MSAIILSYLADRTLIKAVLFVCGLSGSSGFFYLPGSPEQT